MLVILAILVTASLMNVSVGEPDELKQNYLLNFGLMPLQPFQCLTRLS